MAAKQTKNNLNCGSVFCKRVGSGSTVTASLGWFRSLLWDEIGSGWGAAGSGLGCCWVELWKTQLSRSAVETWVVIAVEDEDQTCDRRQVRKSMAESLAAATTTTARPDRCC